MLGMASWFTSAVCAYQAWWSGGENIGSPLTAEEIELNLTSFEIDELASENFDVDDDAETELGDALDGDEEIMGDEPEKNAAWHKKRARKLQLEAAREHKKKFKVAETDLRVSFFEGTDKDKFDALEPTEKKPMLYRIAMERLQSGFCDNIPWTLKNVNLCTKIDVKTLATYQKVWKSIGESDLRHEQRDVFEYYVKNKKPGPQMADPIAMWKMMKRADKFVDNGDSGKCSTIRSMFRNVALPELKAAREASGKNVEAGAATLFRRSYSAMQRLIVKITPFVRKGVGKCTQDRLKAGKNPVGGMSMVAGLKHILEGVHNHNIVCFDSVTTYVNENVPKQVYLTEKKKKQLESKRRGAKAQTGNGQHRSLKINLGLVLGKGLVTCTGIVSDSTFDTLTRFPVTPWYDIIYTPHSPEDEKLQDEYENVDRLSLKYRQSKMLYDECSIPKCLAFAQEKMDFAKHVLKLPDDEVQKMGRLRCFQDGEGGIIHHIMNQLASKLGEVVEGKPKIDLAKGPNAQTESWQVNDMCGIHPEVHRSFASEDFCCASKEFFQAIIDENAGLKAPLKFLQDSGMSTKSKETYRNALAYLIPLMQKCATPAVVAEGFDRAGLYPLNYGKIMHNMYDHFDDLSPECAAEMIRVADQELGAIFAERGVIWARETEAAIRANPILNAVIEFPEMPPNLEHLAWNRQTLVDCSHSVTQTLNRQRAEAADNARQAAIVRTTNAAQLKERLQNRMRDCIASQDATSLLYNCHCGGTFDGKTGFKAHEKNNKSHKEKYGVLNEHGEYNLP